MSDPKSMSKSKLRRILPLANNSTRQPNEKQEVPVDIAELITITNNTDSPPAKEKFVCDICNHQLSSRFRLLSHQRSRHPIYYHSTVKPSSAELEGNTNVCDICEKPFLTGFNLRRHKVKAHNIEIIKKEISSDVQRYKCDICDKMYSQKGKLRDHKIKIHGCTFISKCQQQLKCSECPFTLNTRDSYMKHIENHHGLRINIEIKDFENSEDFEKWKTDTERETASRYKVRQNYTTKKGLHTIMYNCHRCGRFKSKGSGKRRLKAGGSNKIDSFCPAGIVLQSEKAGEDFPVKVKYISTHLGHTCDVGKLGLARDEKEQIAREIQSGVPLRNVLQKISEIASPATRLAATNIQDLWNIAKKYGVNSSAMNSTNELLFVDTWANKSLGQSPDTSGNEDNGMLDFLADGAREEWPVSEKQSIDRSKKHFRQVTKEIVLGFLDRLEDFKTKKQCQEINKTITMLTHRCEALVTKRTKKLLSVPL